MAEFSKDTQFSTRQRASKEASMTSIAQSRVQLKNDLNSFRQGNEEKLYTEELEKQIKYLSDIEDRNKAQEKMLANAKKLQEDMNDLMKSRNIQYDELLEKNIEILNINKKIAEDEFNSEIRKASSIKDREEREQRINEIQNERNRAMADYNALLEDTEEKTKTLENANKSMVEAFSNNLDNLRSEIKDLAVIKGIGDISSGLFGSGNTSMLSAYNSTRSQLGVTASEFNKFKGNLFKQLKDTGNLFEFGWKDTAEYMERLGDLNITSQEMAEQQYLAVIQGTKYLGLQTETQAKILKISKDTGRADLLQQTNETLVQIMNAQLGISRDQLNQMVNQAASLTDMSVFFGGNGDVMQQLVKIQSAVTKEYGKSTSDAAMSILTEIMNNPFDNKYVSNGFIASEYNRIVNYAQKGQMDEAIKSIIEAVQNSQATDVSKSSIYAARALGADNNIMAIANANGSMSNVNKNMTDINNTSKDISETIKDFNKSWSDKLVNFGSNFLSLLPFSEFINLQNAYYAVALVELLVKLPSKLNIITTLLGQIAKSSAIGATGLDNANPKSLGSLLSGKLSPLAAIAAGVTSLLMFYGDAKSGANNADKWGTGKTAAAIGGFIGGTDENGLSRTLKNAGKYALAGAAIGSIFPGIGNVAGWVIGGLVGLLAGGVTGGIGGETIAKGIDSVFGGRKDTEGGVGAAPTMSLPSTGGKGASSNSYPWRITSGFGPRVLSNGDSHTHNGVDFGIRTGTKIGAPISGIISSTQIDNRNTYPKGPSGAGSGIWLQGDDGVMYQFWHLSHVGVQKGQRVNSGELIGLSGNTGYSTGAHLHFGTKVNGSWKNPLTYVTSGLFNANGDRYIDSLDTENLELESKEGERLLQKVISADTMNNQAASYGMGTGNEDVVYAVNSGFAGLSAKLEELSSRQDNQEEVLRQLTSSKRSSIASY